MAKTKFVNAHVCTVCAGSTRPARQRYGTKYRIVGHNLCAESSGDQPPGGLPQVGKPVRSITPLRLIPIALVCGESEYVEKFAYVSCGPGYGSEMMGNAAMTTFRHR